MMCRHALVNCREKNYSAGAGEGVGRMVNGTDLTSRYIARSRACGGGNSYRQWVGGGWGLFGRWQRGVWWGGPGLMDLRRGIPYCDMCVSFGLNLSSYTPTMINYLSHQFAIQWTCPCGYCIFFFGSVHTDSARQLCISQPVTTSLTVKGITLFWDMEALKCYILWT